VPRFDALRAGTFVGTVTLPGTPGGDETAAVNPFLREILGYDSKLPDAEVLPFAPERFADLAARARWLNRLAGQGFVTDHLLRLSRQGGSMVWVEVTASAQVTGVAGRWQVEAFVRDVSERKRLDDQSRDLHQQLLQADKMAALGQTVAGVAHELNNPLATILGWAERLADRHVDEPSQKGAEVILSEARRAARIVRNLLTFARKRQSTRSVVDVNEVVRETLAMRTHDHDTARLTVHLSLAPDVPGVFADTHQIQQVLLNLVINAEQALRASTDGGQLSVRTLYEADGDSIAIEVEDDGPGIPAEMRSRIFDPFFTTKDVGQGTGLGLAVAYAIVQEHGGQIEVASGATGGAILRVALPVGGVQPERPRQVPIAPLDAVKGATVLVVEDEQALAAAVIEALSDAGLRVTYAPDGARALARLRQTRYDVMVCDLKMPRVDGVTLYRTMNSTPVVFVPPVIFVTGGVPDVENERFLEETGCRCLAKPFRLADLLNAVREALA
jgi:PAS domain S-box-containing protein